MTTFALDSDLVFDVGMNDGTDTAAYLAQGYRVVAVEANVALCERAQERFRDEIKSGRLILAWAAIGAQAGFATFWINRDNDHLSSTRITWAGRDQARLRQTVVGMTTVEDLIRGYGSPLYIKFDVEGAEGDALKPLATMWRDHARPLFISIEDSRETPERIGELQALGYDCFALSEQSQYLKGSSGPFGADLPETWLPAEEFLARYHRRVRHANGERIAPKEQWFDVHATNLAAFALYQQRRAA